MITVIPRTNLGLLFFKYTDGAHYSVWKAQKRLSFDNDIEDYIVSSFSLYIL